MSGRARRRRVIAVGWQDRLRGALLDDAGGPPVPTADVSRQAGHSPVRTGRHVLRGVTGKHGVPELASLGLQLAVVAVLIQCHSPPVPGPVTRSRAGVPGSRSDAPRR